MRVRNRDQLCTADGPGMRNLVLSSASERCATAPGTSVSHFALDYESVDAFTVSDGARIVIEHDGGEQVQRQRPPPPSPSHQLAARMRLPPPPCAVCSVEQSSCRRTTPEHRQFAQRFPAQEARCSADTMPS